MKGFGWISDSQLVSISKMRDGRIQIVWRGRQAHFKTDYSHHTAVRLVFFIYVTDIYETKLVDGIRQETCKKFRYKSHSSISSKTVTVWVRAGGIYLTIRLQKEI
jgi:hypothetical protein